VFVTGGTGYIGRRLLAALVARRHRVQALVRSGSESKLPPGCEVLVADPFDRTTFAEAIPPCDTFVQLLGVPHPSPRKARQFIDIDLRSATESIAAARSAGVTHFVYVSVAHPAPVMQAYQGARQQAEETLTASGLTHTVIRPWYVLGPGHRWPYLLIPVYWILERVPSSQATAKRLGLVTLSQMVAALVQAVEDPPSAARIIEVPDIRKAP
jgi:uncharacterized protein YbjT (DUF2867 family)